MLERMTTDEFDIVEMVHLIADHNEWSHKVTETPTVVITLSDHIGEFVINAFDTPGMFHIYISREFEFLKARELEVRRLMDSINRTTGGAYFNLHESGEYLVYRTSVDFDDDRPLSNDWIEDVIKTMHDFYSLASESFFSIAGIRIDESESIKNGIVCLDTPVTASEALDMIFKNQAGHA